mmetsp:Transcript_7211/g.11896  ORF Transcript_7211/g.11896 Transcript_7211/m.11896 type:complete len:93 (+) Transcript_7211:855-1133(+)
MMITGEGVMRMRSTGTSSPRRKRNAVRKRNRRRKSETKTTVMIATINGEPKSISSKFLATNDELYNIKLSRILHAHALRLQSSRCDKLYFYA